MREGWKAAGDNGKLMWHWLDVFGAVSINGAESRLTQQVCFAGVFGNLKLHGQVSGKTWHKLGATAESGSTSITLAEAPDASWLNKMVGGGRGKKRLYLSGGRGKGRLWLGGGRGRKRGQGETSRDVVV